MQTLSKFNNLLPGLCLMVLLGLNVPFPGQVSPYGPRVDPDNTYTPIRVQLKIDKLPALRQTATLRCEAGTAMDAPGTTIDLNLPDGVQLTGGSAHWSGKLVPGSPVVVSATARFTKLGDSEISCRAHRQIDPGNSWGDMATVYVSIGAKQSQSGFARRGIAVATWAGDGEARPVDSQESPNLPSQEAQPLPPPPPVAPASEGGTSPAVAQAPLGNLTVTGTFKYYNRKHALVGANQFALELLRADNGEWLAWCYTDTQGRFSCGPVTNPGSAGIKVYMFSYVAYTPYGDVLDVTRPSCGTSFSCTYAVTTKKFVLKDGTHSIGTLSIPKGETYERAFWTKDDLDRAYKYIWFKAGVSQTPQETAGPSTILWSYDSTDGTYYNWGGAIHLMGQDPLSHDTAIHEYGHNVMWTKYGGWMPTTYCPSPHYIQGQSHFNCAWVEGWAEYLPMVVNNDPNYDWASGARLNLEKPTWGTANFDAGDDVEGRVAGALWDITDAAKDGTDTYQGDFKDIWDTLFHQTDNNFQEFWTAWKARGHNTANDVMSIYQNTIDYRAGAVPRLNLPANGAVLTTHTPVIGWGSVMSTLYSVEVRSGSTTGTVVVGANVNMTGGKLPSIPSGRYYWRVRAYDGSAWGAWSGWRNFKIN
jgi:hypothetical protein